MSANDAPGALGEALVAFTTAGAFPEEDVSSLQLNSKQLPSAIQALAEAKSKIEAEIHTINEETAPDVSTWQKNAKSLQDDIVRSKQLASNILRQAQEPAVSGEAIQEVEVKVAFLQSELAYTERVREALRSVKDVSVILDQAEAACNERRILDALRLLEKSWEALDALPMGRSVRPLKLLDLRTFELKNTVHQVFDHVWKALVHVDMEEKTILITKRKEGEAMSLSDAVVGLKAYKEVDQRMAQLWHEVDQAVLGPRMDIEQSALHSVLVEGDTLQAKGQADKSVDALFSDMDTIFSFFSQRLPAELIESVSAHMMPEVVSRIIEVWLNSAVPTSLKEMDQFESVMNRAKQFCARLSELNYTGFNELQEWVEDAPKVWLSKCRETALDAVRLRLSQGLGAPKQVERVEKQMVSRAEGQELAAVPTTAAAAGAEDEDWGAAWDDDGEQEDEIPKGNPLSQNPQTEGAGEDGTDAWGWGDDAETQEPDVTKPEAPTQDAAEEEDVGDAWGWGDEETQEDASKQVAQRVSSTAHAPVEEQRELTLKETYNISSMPEPVLQLVFAILEDGAALTQAGFENSPVAKAAAGLFGLPTFALAMFRAVGPYYYTLDIGGSMYLYNDAIYLAEKLGDFAKAWKERSDLSPQAQKSLRLDNDIETLQKFAARAYANEMSTQKTVLRDLLGGDQTLLQQEDIDSFVDAAIARVRAMAVTWETILPRSAWYQAVGSLVDAVSLKIIADVMEAPSIGQDDAYSIAKLIASVTELDDLFLPSRATGRLGGDEAPQTMQYAGSWLRLKYLSEVLQSNLKDVRFLWLESELSLFFNVDEVVDLINLSFEDNPRTREVIKEITSNPHPLQEEEAGGW